MKKAKTTLGQKIIEGLEDALAYERGQKSLRTTTFEIPDEPPHWSAKAVANLRKNVLGMSQPVFAACVGVSPAAVKAWEQGLKTPSGAASRLLQIFKSNPSILKRLADKKDIAA